MLVQIEIRISTGRHTRAARQILVQALGALNNGAAKARTQERIGRRSAIRAWRQTDRNIRAALERIHSPQTGIALQVTRSLDVPPAAGSRRFHGRQTRRRKYREVRPHLSYRRTEGMEEASKEQLRRAWAAAHFPEAAHEASEQRAFAGARALAEGVAESVGRGADEN